MKYINYVTGNHPLSEAVLVNDIIYSSGIRAVDMETGKLLQKPDIEARVSCCLDNLNEILKKSGSSLSKTLYFRIYTRNIKYAPAINRVISSRFNEGKCPAASIFEVNRLEDDHDIEIDSAAAANADIPVEYYNDDEIMSPYSSFVKYGKFVMFSALTPSADNLKYDELQFQNEVRVCFDRIKKLLNQIGSEISNVFRTRVYLRNMRDRSLVNEVTREYFSDFPLRVITEISRLPGEQRFCIECDSYIGSEIEYIQTSKGQKPTGPFSQGIRIGNNVFCSGVRPIDPKTGRLVVGDFKMRVVRCMENLNAVLQAGGVTMDHVFESRVYMRNLADLNIVDEVFRQYFKPGRYPIRTAIEISRLNEDYEKGWEPNHDVEIEFSAYDG